MRKNYGKYAMQIVRKTLIKAFPAGQLVCFGILRCEAAFTKSNKVPLQIRVHTPEDLRKR